MIDPIGMEQRLPDLTAKQRETVKLLIDCHSTKEIARILGISPSTVEQRLTSVRRKYGLLSRREIQRRFRHTDAESLERAFVETSEALVKLPETEEGHHKTEIDQGKQEVRQKLYPFAWQFMFVTFSEFLLGWAMAIVATLAGVLIGKFLTG